MEYAEDTSYLEGDTLRLKKQAIEYAEELCHEHVIEGYHLTSLVFMLHEQSIDLVDATEKHFIIAPIQSKRFANNHTAEHVKIKR